VRVWPAYDRQGNLIPDTYIAAQDFAGTEMTPSISSTVNFDYQDNVYLLTNLKPSGQRPQPGRVLLRIDTGSATSTKDAAGNTWISDKNPRLYTPDVPDEVVNYPV